MLCIQYHIHLAQHTYDTVAYFFNYFELLLQRNKTAQNAHIARLKDAFESGLFFPV